MVAATISTIAVPKHSILDFLQVLSPHLDAAVQMADHDSQNDHYHNPCPHGYSEIDIFRNKSDSFHA